MERKDRTYDLVLFGATSFVGQLVTRYLLETYGLGRELSWAVAGRSEARLELLRQTLGAAGQELPVIIADADNYATLESLCHQTCVVVSTVGPYALYGEPLIQACTDTGTDYCDLSGEVQWIRRMIRSYESKAKASGARIVHCCGFDSIPSDMGVWHLQQQARELFGIPCQDVRMRVKALRGGLSGGTIASMINIARETATDPSLRRELANPFSLCPPGHRSHRRQPAIKSAGFDKTFGAWLAPFLMGAINIRVVHRSNALMQASYGQEFTYDEAMITGKGMKGRAKAYAITAAITGFFMAAAVRPSRWLVEKLVPQPGEGPAPEAQEAGFYDLRFVGTTADGRTLITKVTGDRDPGYGSTARMLGEAAMTLAFDVPAEQPGGFWTPASLLNGALLERLRTRAGLTFEVLETR